MPYQALSQALASCDVCAREETLAELEQVLDREKFDLYLDRESRREFVALIRRNIHLFAIRDAELPTNVALCRDPRDNRFLALALAAEADAVVSSDGDLLALNPWSGIAIMTPAEFLSQFKADAGNRT